MHKLRKTLKLIITTDLTDAEISKIVGSNSNIISRLRFNALSKKCDWQKIKAMNDIELRELFKAKCPNFAMQILSKSDYSRPPPINRNMNLKIVWDEYRRAHLYDL